MMTWLVPQIQRNTMNSIKNACALTASLAVMGFAIGQAQAKPIVYPSKGQSPQQQQKDEGECYVWAKNSTGIDPGRRG
jgi:hypothetical protein